MSVKHDVFLSYSFKERDSAAAFIEFVQGDGDFSAADAC